MTKLSDPLELPCGVEIKNRFCKSAMSEILADKGHNPSKNLCKLYETWAEGGIGVQVTGNVMVDRTALGEPRNVVLDEKSDLAKFERWAEAGTKNGTQLWMQLNHPGKQSPKFLTSEPVAPSSIALGKGLEKSFAKPRALTEDEILGIIDAFGLAAERAKEAGFSGVQIHGAHGYLVSQFLSPRHNQRTDQWGGPLANRVRFLEAVYSAIRERVGPEFPVGLKLNSSDFIRGGFTEEEALEVMQRMEALGLDLLEISGGGYESPTMLNSNKKVASTGKEAYFLPFAQKAKESLKVPVVVTGGFRSGAGMAAALVREETDMIGLARPMCLYTDMPNQLLADQTRTFFLTEPTTGFKAVDKALFLNLTWYEQQLALIGKGKGANVNLSPIRSSVQTVLGTGIDAFRVRRG